MATFLAFLQVREIQKFRPSAGAAAALSVKKKGDLWLLVDPEDPNKRIVIFPNDVFGRVGTIVPGAASGDEDVFTPLDDERGQWTLLGRAGTVDTSQYLRVRAVAPHVSAPGATLKDPFGENTFSDGGPPLNRPEVGEQELDPWTGDPLVDANGDPVLVPA